MVAITGVIGLQSCQDRQQGIDGNREIELISAKRPFNEKVSYQLAMRCVKLYENTSLGRIKKKTLSVTFDRKLLKEWTDSLDLITDYDKMAIRFGIYDSTILAGRTDAESRKDKLTVFLFPTLNGAAAVIKSNKQNKEVDPFNMGEVYP